MELGVVLRQRLAVRARVFNRGGGENGCGSWADLSHRCEPVPNGCGSRTTVSRPCSSPKRQRKGTGCTGAGGRNMDRWPDVRRQSARRAVSDPRMWTRCRRQRSVSIQFLVTPRPPTAKFSGVGSRKRIRGPCSWPPFIVSTRKTPASLRARPWMNPVARQRLRPVARAPFGVKNGGCPIGSVSWSHVQKRGEEDRLMEEVVDEAVAAEEAQRAARPGLRASAPPAPGASSPPRSPGRPRPRRGPRRATERRAGSRS